MRLRNSCGSESSVSSTTLTKSSRLILHPVETDSGTLTPSSRYLCRHLHPLRRRLPLLPLRLLRRLAPVEPRHRQLPSDQSLIPGILAVFWSCSIVRLIAIVDVKQAISATSWS